MLEARPYMGHDMTALAVPRSPITVFVGNLAICSRGNSALGRTHPWAPDRECQLSGAESSKAHCLNTEARRMASKFRL